MIGIRIITFVAIALLMNFSCVSAHISGKTANLKVTVSESLIQIKNAPKKYKKITLENDKILISVLPELGARIYQIVLKSTGNNQLYNNSIWQKTEIGGVNSCRPGKDWKALGGVEIAFPETEHGCIYDRPFDYKILHNPDGSKKIALSIGPSVETWGLKLYIDINLAPGNDYFEINSIIVNPKKNPEIKFQYWLNAMLTPGGGDPRKGNLELFYPPEVTSMIYHGGASSVNASGIIKVNKREVFSWPNKAKNYDQLKKIGPVSFFSEIPTYYQAIISHNNGEGILKVFMSREGVKFYGPGTIDFKNFSNKDLHYVELWNGMTRDFWSYTLIDPGESIMMTEFWEVLKFPNNIDIKSQINNAATKLRSEKMKSREAEAITTSQKIL